MIETVAPYLHFFLTGAAVTAALVALSFPLSVALGLLIAFGSTSAARWLSCVCAALITVCRGLPEILFIFLIFYGASLLSAEIEKGLGVTVPRMTPFLAATVALALQFSGYAAIVFRDWLAIFPKGQAEAGFAVGLTPAQVRARIVIPFLLRSATPALGNLFLVLVKVTALASLIGVEELSRKTGIVAGALREPLICYAIAALMYLALTALSDAVQSLVERRQSRFAT